jgi:hypothetical protein
MGTRRNIMQTEHSEAATKTNADELEALSSKWRQVAKEISDAKKKHPNGKGWWH